MPIFESDINNERKMRSILFMSLQQSLLVLLPFKAIGQHFQMPQLHDTEFVVAVGIIVNIFDYTLFYKISVDVREELALVNSDYLIILVYVFSLIFAFWAFLNI